MYNRPKQEPVYATTANFYDEGNVRYVAHAITANSAIPLGKVVQNERKESVTELDHPDRLFWSGTHPYSLNDLIKANKIRSAADLLRIEIDCTLMPCDAEWSGCLFKVPNEIKAYGYPGTLELRIFSHRSEGLAAKTGSTKRYITCKVDASREDLKKAYANNEDWSWAG
jgi:hypothetical protein